MRQQSPGRNSRWTTLLVAAALLLGASCDPISAAASQSQDLSAAGHAPTAGPQQCESKTINYITHTLPQQCLRTNWTSPDSGDATDGSDSAHVAQETGRTVPDGQNTAAGDQAEGQVAENEGEGGVDDDGQEDLATSSFMSFEEWKELQLRKSGQDPADLQARKKQEQHRGDSYSGSSNGHLDSLDDDGEISLDFDALSEKVSELTSGSNPSTESATREDSKGSRDAVLYDDGRTQYYRSKDAGKTCKERFSYASFDAGATVLKTSSGAKNAKAILVENKDSYMLLECNTQNKYFIVELSDDILVDTVVLANFEFFSSMIRRFRVSVSDRWPVKAEKWKELGLYEARNSRDIQPFLIEHPQIWAKYIRIEVLTHYGNEYYCPISLFRVHGTRMLDSWKESEGGREDEESFFEEAEEVAEPSHPEPTEVVVADTQEEETLPEEYEFFSKAEVSPWHPVFYSAVTGEVCAISSAETTPAPSPSNGEPESTRPSEQRASTTPPSSNGLSSSHVTATTTSNTTASSTQESVSTSSRASATNISKPSSTTPANNKPSSASAQSAQSKDSASKPSASPQPPASSQHKQSNNRPPAAASSSPSSPRSYRPTTILPKPSHRHHPSSRNRTSSTSTPPSDKSVNGHSNNNNNGGGSNGSGNSHSPPPPPSPSPTVQESFFKSITKRLQLLESNTSLSLQYIEDQSLFLREALGKMERRQLARVDAFLTSLNGTVLAELRAVRQQYDQVWQSTVIALESQRERSEREMVALSDRLSLLADEVVFQKRMAILQAVLLLSCLVLVIFSRGIGGSVLGAAGSSATATGAAALLELAMAQYGAPMLGSPTTPPYRRGGFGGGSGEDRARALSRSKSYPDKVLPLTPTSESVSREGSPPTAQQPSYFEEEEKTWNVQESNMAEQPAEDASTAAQRHSVSVEGQELDTSSDIDTEVTEFDMALPTLTVTSAVGGARKPLPALPEDPT